VLLCLLWLGASQNREYDWPNRAEWLDQPPHGPDLVGPHGDIKITIGEGIPGRENVTGQGLDVMLLPEV